jgi:hypothetical protein
MWPWVWSQCHTHTHKDYSFHACQSVSSPTIPQCVKWAHEQKCHGDRDGNYISAQHKDCLTEADLGKNILCSNWPAEAHTEPSTQHHAADMLAQSEGRLSILDPFLHGRAGDFSSQVLNVSMHFPSLHLSLLPTISLLGFNKLPFLQTISVSHWILLLNKKIFLKKKMWANACGIFLYLPYYVEELALLSNGLPYWRFSIRTFESALSKVVLSGVNNTNEWVIYSAVFQIARIPQLWRVKISSKCKNGSGFLIIVPKNSLFASPPTLIFVVYSKKLQLLRKKY